MHYRHRTPALSFRHSNEIKKKKKCPIVTSTQFLSGRNKTVTSWMPNHVVIVRRYPIIPVYHKTQILSSMQWFASGAGGVHTDQREHLRNTCRHKHLHLPPYSDPRVWDISFPDSEECEHIMAPK